MSASDPRLAQLIGELVKRQVAVTSTLAVFDALNEQGFRHALTKPVLDALSTETRARLLQNHLAGRIRRAGTRWSSWRWRSSVRSSRRADAAGGCDPTGNGAVLAGYGDQREVELLVDAGFSPVER